MTFKQKYISIPIVGTTDEGEAIYDKCNVYKFNYSAFTIHEYLHWNRTERATLYNSTVACTQWTYNQGVMVDSIVNTVCTNVYSLSKLPSRKI